MRRILALLLALCLLPLLAGASALPRGAAYEIFVSSFTILTGTVLTARIMEKMCPI